MHRVQKLLSSYGYCSRRRAEELIKQGRVEVNGKTISIGDKASEEDRIQVDGKLVKEEKRVYLIFNKPLGCVTALRDRHYKIVMDYIDIKERVFPVGRLDKNTSGLLIMTNDGDFANNVMHPRYEVKKTYMVRTDKPVFQRDIDRIEAGIKLEDGMTSPAKVKRHEATLLEVTIHEGKKRIIRRIFEKLGFNVGALERIRIGGLEMHNLYPGKYKILSRDEIDKVFS